MSWEQFVISRFRVLLSIVSRLVFTQWIEIENELNKMTNWLESWIRLGWLRFALLLLLLFASITQLTPLDLSCNISEQRHKRVRDSPIICDLSHNFIAKLSTSSWVG